MTIAGKRVLAVGASSGIGRAFAIEAVRAGADVALAARRLDRVKEAAASAGHAHALACDVRRHEDCRRVVTEAVAALGGIDLVLYAAGRAPLQALIDTNTDEWQDVLDTNVVGLQRITREVLPHLSAGGIVAVLSSETVGKPRTGLGAYAASKAALDESLRTWRLEHPEHRFACLTVGATQPTEFGSDFEMSRLEPAMRSWYRHGLMQAAYMDTAEVATFMVTMLGAALALPTISVENLTLRSPSPVVGPDGA